MSRYDWSKTPDWVKYKATDPDGIVWNYAVEPKIDECNQWSSEFGPACRDFGICLDWKDSLEERPKWEPEERELVFILDPCYDSGYGDSRFTKRSKNYENLFKRGFIVRTEAEAIAKVKELGWV